MQQRLARQSPWGYFDQELVGRSPCGAARMFLKHNGLIRSISWVLAGSACPPVREAGSEMALSSANTDAYQIYRAVGRGCLFDSLYICEILWMSSVSNCPLAVALRPLGAIKILLRVGQSLVQWFSWPASNDLVQGLPSLPTDPGGGEFSPVPKLCLATLLLTCLDALRAPTGALL